MFCNTYHATSIIQLPLKMKTNPIRILKHYFYSLVVNFNTFQEFRYEFKYILNPICKSSFNLVFTVLMLEIFHSLYSYL